MRKNANTEARRFLSWRPPYGSSLECVRADSNKLINMTDTYSAGGKGWLELDSTSRSHGTTLSRIPSSDIERTGLWRVIAGCIMYRRLSFSVSLSGIIFRPKREEFFEKEEDPLDPWKHGARAISPRVLSRVVKRREHRHYRGGER